jgi:enoyl-CoA hydratase/carnithine racemase
VGDDLGTGGLRLERDGPIAWCTIDRPAARNALTPAMYFGIKRAVQLVNRDPELGALILTGTGDVFAPGGDMAGRYEEGEEPVPEHVGYDILPFLTVRDSRAPVISAVNGICQGGGLLIALLSDIAVASERATFRAPELLRGVPDAFYASALPAHVGVAVARDLLFSARRIDAEEALRIGLISRVVPHDELRDAALEAARQVLRTAPFARMQVKRMLNERYGNVDLQTFGWALDESDEPREGMRSFMEKRPPSWVPEGLEGGER